MIQPYQKWSGWSGKSQEMARNGQEMSGIDQDMIRKCQEMVQDGQEMVQDGQETVQNDQDMFKKCQEMIRMCQEKVHNCQENGPIWSGNVKMSGWSEMVQKGPRWWKIQIWSNMLEVLNIGRRQTKETLDHPPHFYGSIFFSVF